MAVLGFSLGFYLDVLSGVGLLADAILRHQLFDIDIKVKWTLKRGTVAAAFLAVLFVAAQVAQNFLSTRFGWGLGGAAAGLMLFAIRSDPARRGAPVRQGHAQRPARGSCLHP